MKQDGRTVAHETLQAMRLIALERMAEGERPADVSASFGLHRTWAYKVRAKARGRGRGKRALRSTRGTGRPRKLDVTQERQVFRWVNGNEPGRHGFDVALWTRSIVRDLIARSFGVALSLASVGTLLDRQGLTPRKPLQQAYRRDPLAIARWQQEIYPSITRQAKREKAEIYFWDESGFRADTVHGSNWSAADDAPVMPTSRRRHGPSAASAVSARGGFWFTTYKGGLNGMLFVTLLRKMMRGRRKPLHLILDGLPAHQTKAVRDYVGALNGKLMLHFLPGSRRTGIRTGGSGKLPGLAPRTARAAGGHTGRVAPRTSGWRRTMCRHDPPVLFPPRCRLYF